MAVCETTLLILNLPLRQGQGSFVGVLTAGVGSRFQPAASALPLFEDSSDKK